MDNILPMYNSVNCNDISRLFRGKNMSFNHKDLTSLGLDVPNLTGFDDMSWLGAAGGSIPPEVQLETELHKMVTDEKLRSEQHKINYQQLKTEHSKLQDEYMKIQDDLKTTVEESRFVQERYRTLVDDGKRALMDKHAELDDIRTQVITPRKLEAIRHQVAEEIERPFKERYLKLERELDEATNNYNKIRYDMSFLSAEYEHEKGEHEQIVNEIRLQYEAEVTNLRKEREAMLSKVQTESQQNAEHVHTLQRNNTELSIKNKSLREEIEEVQALQQKISFEMDQLTRSHDKQTTELTSSIKSLEAEKDSLRRQIEIVQKELVTTAMTHEKLTNRLHELESENVLLRHKSDELIHQNKMDMSDLRMEMIKQKGETERQRDSLANKLEDVQTQLEITQHKVTRQDELLDEKEKECVKKVQAVRGEEWEKTAHLENQKLELETKIQEMTRIRLDDENVKQAIRDKFEGRLDAANDARQVAEREALIAKTELASRERQTVELEDSRSTIGRLKSRVMDLEDQVSRTRDREQEMADIVAKLKNQNIALVDESRASKHQLERYNETASHMTSQQHTVLVNEQNQKEAHLKEMNVELGSCRRKVSSVVKSHKKFKAKCVHVIHNYKDKVQLQRAKIEQLKIEKQAVQNFVPPDVFKKVQRQLKDLQKRNAEFRHVIHSGSQQCVPIGDLKFTRIVPNSESKTTLFDIQENQHEDDVRQLKRRLETLDTFQQQQLEALRSLTNSVVCTDRTVAHDRNCGNNMKIPPYFRSKLDEMSPVALNDENNVHFVKIDSPRSEKCDNEKSLKSENGDYHKDDFNQSGVDNREYRESFKGDNDLSLKMDHLSSSFKEEIVVKKSSAFVDIDTFTSSAQNYEPLTKGDDFGENINDKPDIVERNISDGKSVKSDEKSLKLDEKSLKSDEKSLKSDEKGHKDDTQGEGNSLIAEIDDKSVDGVELGNKCGNKTSSEIEEDISLKSGDEYSLKFDDSITDDEKW